MDHPITINLVFKLIDRGLTIEKIDAAMVNMIGGDWRVITVADWIRKFKEKGYVPKNCAELSIDDLELLIERNLKQEQMAPE